MYALKTAARDRYNGELAFVPSQADFCPNIRQQAYCCPYNDFRPTGTRLQIDYIYLLSYAR